MVLPGAGLLKLPVRFVDRAQQLTTIRAIAETGVDFISVGRITQSAPAVDIGLDYALIR